MEQAVLEEYIFEPLYGKDIKGKIKIWRIKVEKYAMYSEIVTFYGISRLIETRRRINSGKNLNKINATTHFQQAVLEATSKFTKKKNICRYIEKNNIADSIGETIEENNTIKDTVNPLPMLAQDYNKHKKKVKYPCYVQMKLDGMRMIYNSTTGQITTRQGKEYSIIKESGELYNELKKIPKGLILDGELYTNKVNFEMLGVLRKTKKLTKNEKINLSKIEYHIYDIINLEQTYEHRHEKIKELFVQGKYVKLIYVSTFLVKTEEEINNYHKIFISDGFEGTMIRNRFSLYKTKCRSSDLLKYKNFMDDEFKITGFTLEKDTSGDDENLVIWIISVPLKIDGHVTDPGLEIENNKIKVKVRPQGTKQERKELYKKCVENFEQFKGRNLWTKFFEYTNDGSLRFPTTKTNSYESYIRDDIL